jgi:hypothetical protein
MPCLHVPSYYSRLPRFLATTVALAILLAAAAPLLAAELPSKICFGDATHPVVSGEAWVVANRWGWYQAVLVGTIREGRFERRANVEFPRYWEQAFDYRLLLAVSGHATGPPARLETDDAYGWFGRRPEYLKDFPTVYLSSPLPKESEGRNWESALETVGRVADGILVLPLFTRRTLRLLYPNGEPLAGRKLLVSLYGSSENHCGVAVGIWLGDFVTDTGGEVQVTAPNCHLAVSTRYYEQVDGGPAGTAYALLDNFIVGGGEATTVRHLWTLPEHEYVVRLWTAAGQPIEHAHLEGCLFRPPCMSGCGPVPVPQRESDASGTIRFRDIDLREMGTMAVVDAAGRRRDLDDAEMRELMTTHRLNLTWK